MNENNFCQFQRITVDGLGQQLRCILKEFIKIVIPKANAANIHKVLSDALPVRKKAKFR